MPQKSRALKETVKNPASSPAKDVKRPNAHHLSRNQLLQDPIQHIRLDDVANIADLVDRLGKTSYQSRNLSRCFKIFMSMLTDPQRPVVFLGLSGAMVPGGMKKIICDMMRLHAVDVLVSTGANLSHDLYESLGAQHFLAKHRIDDVTLREFKIDRVYDTYADDLRFIEADDFVIDTCNKLSPRAYSSCEFLRHLGSKVKDSGSVLRTAYEEQVPVFAPALNDSSIGIAITAHRYARSMQGKPSMTIDSIKDNLEILSIKQQHRKSGAIFIGGGVPKNFIQQVIPMGEIVNVDVEPHSYAIQITTDDPKYGGLSGCELEESQSWGKLTYDAKMSTVYMDATIGLPLLMRAALDRKEEWYPRPRLKIDWDSKQLTPFVPAQSKTSN